MIWCVQRVHYPLFALVGKEGFAAYEAAHSRWITIVVGPPMLLEASTTALLLFFRPPAIRWSEVLIGAALLALIWLSTMFLQVPQHTVLSSGFDARADSPSWPRRGGVGSIRHWL